jgi:hypothetical protein
MTYENTAANDAPNGTITTMVPSDTQFEPGVSSPGWSCASNLAGAECIVDVGTIAGNGRTGNRDFAVIVDSSVPNDVTEISITATVSYDGSAGDDPDPSDNMGTDTTPIVIPPIFNKAFSPDAIGLNQSSRITFTVDNTAGSLTASNLDFTDNLPAGMIVADPPNGATSCTGGNLTADADTVVVSYSGGMIAAMGTCIVEVDVVGTAIGLLSNTTGSLTSSSGDSGAASASLTVNPPAAVTPVPSLNLIGLLLLTLLLASFAFAHLKPSS